MRVRIPEKPNLTRGLDISIGTRIMTDALFHSQVYGRGS